MTQERMFDLSGVSVYIAIPCYTGVVPIELAINLAWTALTLKNSGVECYIGSERENGLITQVRNKLVWRFLNESTADYLFWIDDDIIFQPNDFLSILALATEFKVVAASYPTRNEKQIFFMKFPNEHQIEIEPEFGLLKAKGCGLGFTCIHRSVIEHIVADRTTYIDQVDIEVKDLFRISIRDNQHCGEDINFFQDLYDLGYTTYINPNIMLKHVGRKDYQAQLNVKEILNASSS